MQHFLYFTPLPQGQGSFRPTFTVFVFIDSLVFILSLSPKISGYEFVGQPLMLVKSKISISVR
jgi:hypothetical protein